VSPETTLQDAIPLVPDEKARASEAKELARLAQSPGVREFDPTGPWDVVSGSGPLFSAPHAVTHIRDGAEKLAEHGTGPLARALARYISGTGITTAGVQTGDPNWDPRSPYLERAYILADGNPTIDIHIMRPRGVELCIGLGPFPQLADGLWQIFAEEAVAGGLRVSLNWPFAANTRTVTSQLQARGNKAVQDFLGYLEILVERRRAKPGNPERDVLTRLIQGEDNGERLTSKELLHNCIFLLNAGHETTTNLIGNGLVALSGNPAQKKRLIEHPDLIKTAIEEFLRFESSNQLGNRMTTERVELGGIALAAGTPVTLCIGAANRDPQQFADPENLDIGRMPNRHLAFATGAHQCAGMALARLEGAIAISRFLARFPEYELSGPPVRGGRVRFRGFLSVPCAVGQPRAN